MEKMDTPYFRMSMSITDGSICMLFKCEESSERRTITWRKSGVLVIAQRSGQLSSVYYAIFVIIERVEHLPPLLQTIVGQGQKSFTKDSHLDIIPEGLELCTRSI
jgi:hypothetical protein